MAKKKKSELMALKADDFAKVIKSRLVEKYADDAISLIEDTKKLKKSYEKFQSWVDRVEAGEFVAIEEYKKQRAKLQEIDDYEVE